MEVVTYGGPRISESMDLSGPYLIRLMGSDGKNGRFGRLPHLRRVSAGQRAAGSSAPRSPKQRQSDGPPEPSRVRTAGRC